MGFVCLFILGGVFFAGYAYHGDVEQNQINQLNADLRVTQAALTADEQKLADKKDEKTAQNAAVVTPAASDIVPVIKSTEYAPPAETIQVPAQKTLATKTKEL